MEALIEEMNKTSEIFARKKLIATTWLDQKTINGHLMELRDRDSVGYAND